MVSSRSASMSMKDTSLSFRFGVRQRSLTSPSENTPLPAPITEIRTDCAIAATSRPADGSPTDGRAEAYRLHAASLPSAPRARGGADGSSRASRRRAHGGRSMPAGLTDRAQSPAAGTAWTDLGWTEPDRPRVVAAFRHRMHAERAIGALLDVGLASSQITLEGPVGLSDAATVQLRIEGVARAALMGAAALAVRPPGRLVWLRLALGPPALALSLLAGLTAAANPDGIEVFPWTVVVAPAKRRADIAGLLRAFGGR